MPQRVQPGHQDALFASKLRCGWHYFNSSLLDARSIPGFSLPTSHLSRWRLNVGFPAPKAAQAAAAPFGNSAELTIQLRTVKAQILSSCGGSYVENGVSLTETLEEEPGANLLKAWGCAKPCGTRRNPAETWRNPPKPGGTRRKTWRKPDGNLAEFGGKKVSWRGLVGSINHARNLIGLCSQPPPFNLLFFRRIPPGFRQVSARFPPGSAGFRRRVLLGSAGFRQVPPSRVAPGSVRPGFVGLLPTRFLLWTRLQFAFNFLPPVRLWGYPCYCTPPRFNQVSAMIVPKFLASVGQACGNQRRAVYKCPDIAQVSLWKNHEKSPIRGLHISTWKLPAVIDFCIEHVCGWKYP